MTPSKNAAKNAQGSLTSTGSAAASTDTNAVNMLKGDHRKVMALFRKFESSGSSEEKSGIVHEICNELIVHTKLEEEIFYAACREANVEDSLLDEAQVEHDGAKLLIADLLAKSPDSPYYDAQVAVLSEYIKHHVGEEEKPSDGIFAKARAAKLDMNALGQRLQQRKEELLQQVQSGTLAAPVPVSLDLQSVKQDRQENWTMARQNERERDDQGRFMSDDERYGGGRSRSGDDYRYSRESSGGRGRGGWFGDSAGHSRAAQEGWEGREDRGGYSYSSRGRDDEDRYDRGASGRSGSGWYGDPEGHSRASQEGWEHRDNRGRSGYSSRESDDGERYDRGSYGRGRSGGSGWYGDSEGHSRAAHEGWENREGGGRSRMSSRDEDDDRYSSRGSSGSRGTGHGGWFGDPRGHSEAARRGWQDR